METDLKESKDIICYRSGAKFSKIEVKFTNEEVVAVHTASNLKTDGWVLLPNELGLRGYQSKNWSCTIRNKSEVASSRGFDRYK